MQVHHTYGRVRAPRTSQELLLTRDIASVLHPASICSQQAQVVGDTAHIRLVRAAPRHGIGTCNNPLALGSPPLIRNSDILLAFDATGGTLAIQLYASVLFTGTRMDTVSSDPNFLAILATHPVHSCRYPSTN